MSEPALRRRDVVAAVGHATLAALPIAWPFAGRQLTQMVARSLRAFGVTAEAPPATGSGWTTFAIGASGTVTTALLGSGLVYRAEAEPLVASLLWVVAGAVAGALLSPLFLAPMIMAHHAASLSGALRGAWVLGARLGFPQLSGLGALIGVLLSSAWMVPIFVFGDLGLLVAVPTLGLAAGLSSLAVARSYLKVHQGSPPPALGGPLLRPLLLLVPVALCLAAATVSAAALPSRVHLDAPAELRRGTTIVEGALDLGGPAGLVVDGSAMEVRVADGGGVGRLRPPYPAHWWLRAGRTSYQGREAVAVVLLDGDHRAFVTYVDEDGVRLDDGLVERIGSRLGSNGVGLIVLALAFLGLGASRALRRRADARLLTLDAHTPARGAAGALALEGTLRVASGARVWVQGRSVVVEGDASLVGKDGEPRVRLPEGAMELLGEAPDRAPSDGDSACIVGDFESIRGLDFRAGASPWPRGGRLLLGSRSTALAELGDDAARRAAPWLGVSWVCFGLAALVLLLAR